MKKLLLGLATSALAVGGLTATATAQVDGPPDNFGQCIVWIADLGASPSELAPGSHQDHEHYAGPAVVLYDQDGNLVAVHGNQGFDFGIACNYFGTQDVTALYRAGNHWIVEVNA